MTRKRALKKLQLSLKAFRRLCILKGIYPREPRNRKRAQKGATGIKTMYAKKDIQFLMHEPIIWKLREYKIFARKVGRARALKDFATMKRYLRNHPQITLDHIVKERYPTFQDALRDLDDCLTLCFLFSTFPSMPHIPHHHFLLCKRLTMEFLHAVIEAKALRKVFISIKGYYYQAEIQGETVTWIVPHQFAFEPQNKMEVDFKLMSTFVEFYTIMLGFVNFRLYHMLNLHYPPTFSTVSASDSDKDNGLVDELALTSEKIAALNCPLLKSVLNSEEEEVEIDTFADIDDEQKLEEAKKEAEGVKQLKTLFKGLKFFINREVPREPLVFIIRCFGGDVSWDKTLFVGSTFDETDETISHQIVDRPSIDKQYISRYYMQPQWVFDSVNARSLLPVNKYFICEVLPPHLSPFVDKDRDEGYVPPEEKAMYDPNLLEEMHKKDGLEEDIEDEDDDEISNEEGSDKEDDKSNAEESNGSGEEEEDVDEEGEPENAPKQKVILILS